MFNIFCSKKISKKKLKKKMKTSSDDMIDIQIEQSLGRETLMAIDSANFREDLFSILGFVLILIITTIAGILGPKPTETQTSTTKISHLTSIGTTSTGIETQEISMYILNISTYNRFISFSIHFNRKDAQTDIFQNISYSYRIAFYNKGKQTNLFTYQQGKANIYALKGFYKSNSIDLYKTEALDFDQVQFIATLDEPNGYEFIVLSETHGYSQHTLFQIYFKTIFAFIEIAFLLLFVIRLRSLPFNLWHLEQQLTIPLVVLAILYNNPFSIYTSTHPSFFSNIIGDIFEAAFTIYFRFFILVLFDSLRYKNRKTDKYFFLPKIVYSLIMFIVLLISMITENGQIRILPQTPVLSFINTLLFTIYLVWSGFSICIAFCQVDLTERYKFMVYAASGALALTLLAISSVLFDFLGYFKESALGFVEVYAIQNVFVMLMVYFHWPYEILQDQSYMDNSENMDQGEPSSYFFVRDDAEQN